MPTIPPSSRWVSDRISRASLRIAPQPGVTTRCGIINWDTSPEFYTKGAPKALTWCTKRTKICEIDTKEVAMPRRMQHDMPKVKVGMSLHPDVIRELDVHARIHKISRSEVAERHLAAFFNVELQKSKTRLRAA